MPFSVWMTYLCEQIVEHGYGSLTFSGCCKPLFGLQFIDRGERLVGIQLFISDRALQL